VAHALRDGRLHVMPASELVPGDIVEIAGMPTLTNISMPSSDLGPRKVSSSWAFPAFLDLKCMSV